MDKVYIVTVTRLDYDDFPVGSATTHFIGTDREKAIEIAEEIAPLNYMGKVSIDCYDDNSRQEDFRLPYPKQNYGDSGWITRGERGGILRVDNPV